MATKKRPTSHDTQLNAKRQRREQEILQPQDLWKGLDRVRANNKQADVVLKNSCLFIPVFDRWSVPEIKRCVESLHEYIDAEKLRFHPIKNDYGCISLQNFSLLDCCLALSVIFAFKNEKLAVVNARDYLNIPKNATLAGSVYVSNNCVLSSSFSKTHPMIKFSESKANNIFSFKELYINTSGSIGLSSFVNSISSFFSNIRFGKSTPAIIQRFQVNFKRYQEQIGLSINESCFPKGALFDMEAVGSTNKPLIEKSKENLSRYAVELILYNSQISKTQEDSTKDNRQSSDPVPVEKARQASHRQQSTSIDRRPLPPNNNGAVNSNPTSVSPAGRSLYNTSHNSNFMTQEQIKEHCIATINASVDVLKTKSPYQIFKMYVKCPRHNYIDMIYQNLNDLRSQTNCNIVVLNLNNLHESGPWFDSLDVSKYTNFVQRPHPSTVRVVSIGGIGEHMMKALNEISKILST